MEDIVFKLESRSEPVDPGQVEALFRQSRDREIRIRLTAESLGGMKKRATVALEEPMGSKWSFQCDESHQIGGEDSAPPPLVFFSVGIAF